MPNHDSCKKRLKTAKKARLRNRADRGALKSAVRGVTEATTFEEASKNLRDAIVSLDKAAAKGIIHKRNAARHKSRLQAKLARLKG